MFFYPTLPLIFRDTVDSFKVSVKNRLIKYFPYIKKEFYPIIDETLVNNLLNYISVKNKGDNIKDSEKLEKAINISKLGVEEINLKSTNH